MKKMKKILFLPLVFLVTGGTLSAQIGREDAEAEAIYAKEVREAMGRSVNFRHSKAKKATKEKYAGWYMRTKVYAITEDGKKYSHTTAGIFGKLKQSRWKKDVHDIPAFASATFQVVFPHLNWGEDSGDYLSNYYKYTKRRKNKRAVWTFQVKNQHGVDLSNAALRIELEGAQNVEYVKENGQVRYIATTLDPEKRERLTLVDVDNHKTYSVDELEDADLSMDGKHVRTFRWVMGRVKKRDFKPLPTAE